jgi:hypothetical protein
MIVGHFYAVNLTQPPTAMNTKSFKTLCSKTALLLAGSLTLTGVATISHADKANATNLGFNNIDTAKTPSYQASGPIPGSANGPTASANTIYYKDVAAGVDARITANTFGANYSFVDHEVNYTAAGATNGDAAFDYAIAANKTGIGGMTYTIDLFTTTGGVHDYSTAYVAPELRFLIYDVDGESKQSEDVRVASGGGFIGYQAASGTNALTPSYNAISNSYLFSGHNANVSETDPSSSVLLYYQNTSSVTFQFEANTTQTSTGLNYVFSAIDADLSLIAAQNLDLRNPPAGTVLTTNQARYGSFVSTSTAAPEPFTIVGTILGGATALRMKKKLKDSEKV